jgi:hypothetical protein
VIKAHFTRQPTAAAFRAAVRTLRVSESALDAMERQVRERRGSPARAATL